MAHYESVAGLAFSDFVDVSRYDGVGHYSTNLIHYTINAPLLVVSRGFVVPCFKPLSFFPPDMLRVLDDLI